MNYKLQITNYFLRCGFILGALLLAACSLAEDITPPPGIELTQTAAAPAPVIPASPPNPLAGAEIFAQHCIKCHGPTGKGDGELVAQLTGRPPDFTDPATLRDRPPHEIFTIVTQGRLEKTMPPFDNALTHEQRWEVVAFLFTLAGKPTESAEATFATRCAECHVNGFAPDLSALTFFATQTEQAVFDIITTGRADGLHTFTTLSEAERWALARHVRAFAFAPTTIAQNPTPAPAPTPTTPITDGIHISGAIVNGTANARAPDGLVVEVFVFDSASLAGTFTTTVSAGEYSLTSPAPQPEQALVASIQYLGVRYASDIAQLTDGQTQLDLPIEIFETTTDPAVIRIPQWHVILATPQADTVQVAELLVFSNVSDRVFVAAAEGVPALDIPLPEGASNVQFEQGSESYQPTATGFGYMGAVLPGAETLQLIFAFDLPLTRRADWAQTIRYPVEALNLLAPQDGLRLTARGLSGPQITEVQGAPYLAYNGANLRANDSLTMTLTPADAPPEWAGWVVAGLGLLAAGVLGLWWSRQRRGQRRSAPVGSRLADPAQRRATLIDSLARLDDDFANGQLAEPDYRHRRAKLKTEALELMRQPDK